MTQQDSGYDMCASETSERRARNRRIKVIEGTAASASMLCLVHCLALPFLLLLLPGVVGVFAHSEAFHYVALLLVAPTAFAAFRLGYRRHHAIGPVLFGTTGIACLVAALLPGLAEGTESWVTVIGSLLLVAGHTMNWRLRIHAL